MSTAADVVSNPPAGVLPRTLAGFHNRHRGADMLVCGCGESLNLLDDPGRFITVGVNDVGRRFDPDYLVVLNPRSQFSRERFQYIEKTRASAVFTQLHLPIRHPNLVRFKLGKFAGTDFSDPNVLHYTRNSPYVALCLAIHMGASRIGLIGVDFTDHHFFGTSGRHPLARRLGAIDREYRELRSACRGLGVEIFNLSPTSRVTAFPVMALEEFSEAKPRAASPGEPLCTALNIVSYATTPVAGVPDVLARCIRHATPHPAECVWETSGYTNGVSYAGGGIEWKRTPAAALDRIRAADLVIVHNGKVHPKHRRLVEGKPVITMAHNYLWNVDRQFVNKGLPGVVVGQYQATLPEFRGWAVVPNPVPLWEPQYSPGGKNDRVTICYTPSGKHERYPRNHRLYWHAKGYHSTMRVLNALAGRYPVELLVIRDRQLPHARVLEMKRRSHIVIDECVTGGYHRNSLEGLAAGCIVVNGFGLLEGIGEVFARCTGEGVSAPFVGSDLQRLEATLVELIEQGPQALERRGAENRRWLERHWSFDRQWDRHWAPLIARAMDCSAGNYTLRRTEPEPVVSCATETPAPGVGEGASVVIPHGGRARLSNLLCTLHWLGRCSDVREIIVVESGARPECFHQVRERCTKYVFVADEGPFRRGHTLNVGSALAESEYILWLDNDLLVRDGFIRRAIGELNRRHLDFLVPYSSIHYLSQSDSRAISDASRPAGFGTPFKSLRSGRDVIGGAGLVRRKFYVEHGGFENGFRGWGGEDNAWHIKAGLLGKMAVSADAEQCLHHLYHENCGANNNSVTGIQHNPCYADNLALLDRIRRIRTAAQYRKHFPPAPFPAPWDEDVRLRFLVDAACPAPRAELVALARELKRLYGVRVSLCSPEQACREVADDTEIHVIFGNGSALPGRGDGRADQRSRRTLRVFHHEADNALHHFLESEPAAVLVMPFDGSSASALSSLPERTPRYPRPLCAPGASRALNLAAALSLAAGANRLQPAAPTASPPVWVYWEGECPDWIRRCHETIRRHAPGVRILDAGQFERLRYRDRDIDLGRLPLALKADYVRAFLLAHFGGLWIDSDCVVMKPLDEVLEIAGRAPFVAHRERSGLVSNAFIGACYGSHLAERYYRRVCEVLRSGRQVGWTSLGSGPLTELLDRARGQWHELDCRDIQPVCWSRPEVFFRRADGAEHEKALNRESLCYMLSHDRIRRYQVRHRRDDILGEGTYFRFLLDHALNRAGAPGRVREPDRQARVHEREQVREVFRRIYFSNRKLNPESVSGPGSCLARTAVIREKLPALFAGYRIASIVDAACGDFHWFGEIVRYVKRYTGIDVVPELVDANNNKYASDSVRFRRMDISAGDLPVADLIVSRDCLVHFPAELILETLRNFKRSGSKYLLMTTFTRPRGHRDIALGQWRPVNFTRPPFSLPPPLELINEQCDEAGGRYNDKSLGLWALNDLLSFE